MPNPLTLTELARDRVTLQDGTEQEVVWVRAETTFENMEWQRCGWDLMWVRKDTQPRWEPDIERGVGMLYVRPGMSRLEVPAADLPRLYEIMRRVNER